MPANPFTARSGIDPRVFIGREDEISFFRDNRLENAFQGSCQHYVITGIWGIGKTVLLRQMKLVAQQMGAWGLLFCTRGFGVKEDLTSFVRHVLDMAVSEMPIQPKRRSHKLQGAGASALGFGLQFTWSHPSESSGDDPQLILRNGLIQMHAHAIAHGAKALVLMIDDIQNLPRQGHQLTLLRNVLTDEQVTNKTKILVILSSIEEGWNPYLVKNHPVGRLFMPRKTLNSFDRRQTWQLVDQSLNGTGVIFEDAVKDRIYDITQGHVFEIQALCEALFDRQIRGKVSMANWDASLHHTLLSLSDAQFKGMLGRASDIEGIALQEMAHHGDVIGPRELAKRCPGIRSAGEVLKRLTEKGLIERVKRGEYRLTDRLFAEYMKLHGSA